MRIHELELGEYRVHQYDLLSKIEIRSDGMMAVQTGRGDYQQHRGKLPTDSFHLKVQLSIADIRFRRPLTQLSLRPGHCRADFEDVASPEFSEK